MGTRGKRRSVEESRAVGVRVSVSGLAHIEAQCARFGMDRSDYLRGLLAAEVAANAAGRSLFIQGWKP